MKPSLLQAINDRLRAAQQILVVAHVDPDGDAIGSLLGLGGLLGAQGKAATLACRDPVPTAYRFLPGSERVVRQVSARPDLVVSVDCSDRGRMGETFAALEGVPLVNIDHHVTNTMFGDVNWVEPSCASTTQMILDLAEGLGWPISPAVADCLLCGLVTDTRSFRTANVDGETIGAAQRLLAAGASLSRVARQALDLRPLASVRLWGDAVNALQLRDGILWTRVTRAMRKRWSVGDRDTSGLSNFLSGVREARIVAVFSEGDDGDVDVSLRAQPGLDVAQVAFRLGGGGHPLAAGLTLKGALDEVEQRVLAELHLSLVGQEAAHD
ncbi:MAG TPA: bifunctional oligoribonuclease/PAP phosphatase NrnA [Anaerolineae bacterium]|nr:bifunctional oligoribonuclease/PAP phosphatase NrnA [Anaerolineae bacterium]